MNQKKLIIELNLLETSSYLKIFWSMMRVKLEDFKKTFTYRKWCSEVRCSYKVRKFPETES